MPRWLGPFDAWVGSDVHCEASAFFRRGARHATEPGLYSPGPEVVLAYDLPQS